MLAALVGFAATPKNRDPAARGRRRGAFGALLEQTGPEGTAQGFTAFFDLAIRMERNQHLGASLHEPATSNLATPGYKPKKVGTPAGPLTIQVRRAAAATSLLYPQSLERGRLPKSCSLWRC